MSERVTFGESSGLLFHPDVPSAPAVVIVHEWWGLNEQMQALGERWAKAGFVALIPDLFHGKVVPIGHAEDAQKAMASLDFPHAVKELVAAVEYAKTRSTGKVAVTGYCMGGALTFLTACNAKGLAAVVPFYGMPPSAEWSKLEAPVQAHFAKHDDWATVDGAKQLQAMLAELHKSMELHVYDANHAFCNDRRPEVFNAAASSQAWDRAVAFVRRHTT